MSLQEEIIQQLGVKPSIDPQEEIRRSVDFLKRYLKKHPFLKTFVLGISGGQDSTLAGRLAQLAMEEMRAETGDASYQFIAVRLPYGVQADEADAQKALAFIQPDVSLVVNIKESADEMVRAVEATGTEVSDFNKGNIKARSRNWDGPCSGKHYRFLHQIWGWWCRYFTSIPIEQAPRKTIA